MRQTWLICAGSLLAAFAVAVAIGAGTLCGDNAAWWLAVACAANAFAGLASALSGRLYPLAMALPVDLLFYMWVELDAPCALNPYLLYGCMTAVFAAGCVAYYLRFRRKAPGVFLLIFSDVLVNAFFCGLNIHLILI